MYSTYIHKEAVEKELLITESTKAFLDTITDKGAISERDYSALTNSLGKTGASFKITLIVERLYDIPDNSIGFKKEYRHAYAFSSDKGNFPYGKEGDTLYVPTQYFRKFDLVNVNIQQTSMMTYQTNQVRQFSVLPSLRTWTYSRGVRSDGNAIINNEQPIIKYDNN